MPTIIRDGTNTPRTVTDVQMRDGTNTPRDLTELWVRDANNIPRLFWSIAPPMSASASPNPVSGLTSGTGTATTNPTTVSVVGGTPPFTYAWSLVSHSSPVAPTALSPANATTDFRQTSMGPGDFFMAEFDCLVTDSTPGTPQTASTGNVSCFWSDIS